MMSIIGAKKGEDINQQTNQIKMKKKLLNY